MSSSEQQKFVYPVESCTFGNDVEGFLEEDGRVIGAEKVIPPAGLDITDPTLKYKYGKIVLDGVQFEFHPLAGLCRQTQGSYVKYALQTLQRHLAATPSIKISLKSVVNIDDDVYEKLSPAAKLLGCGESLNVYEDQPPICVPPDFKGRSAGGHIHMGIHNAVIRANPKPFVKALDALVGNTCVLIDREPLAAERRMSYGRAGEYRMPAHGVEYRTLSNFWLQDWHLMSFVLGMARLALNVTTQQQSYGENGYSRDDNWKPLDELNTLIDQEAIRKAINENDLELAKENFKGVKEFLVNHVPNAMPLNVRNIAKFEYFTAKVQENGLDYWFKGDPIKRWETYGGMGGWESFLDRAVAIDQHNQQGAAQ